MTNPQTFDRRISNFRTVLSEHGLDAILLVNFWAETSQGGDYNLYYISNLLNRFMQCFLVITAKECTLWVDNEDELRAKKETPVTDIELMGVGENWGFTADEFAQLATRAIGHLTGKAKPRVGINGRFLPGSVELPLMGGGLDLIDVGRSLEISRIVKDTTEMELMRKAAHIADLGVQKVMEAVAEGITEFELVVLAEAEMRHHGAECFWWKSLVGSGPEAETWPDSPSHRKIIQGDLVIMDFTPVYGGYGGDIARSFVFGTPSKGQIDLFHLAQYSLGAGIAALKDGVTCREIMGAAAQPVLGTPYEKSYIGIGHGIGLYNDNYPNFLAPLSKMNVLPESVLSWQMRTDMVVAMEVIFTVPGLGGVRLEDNYVVTPLGAQKLTHAPIVLSRE